jgi:hypothetical protein
MERKKKVKEQKWRARNIKKKRSGKEEEWEWKRN